MFNRGLKHAVKAAVKEAQATGKIIRVFDTRYATAGLPDEITNNWIRFPETEYEIYSTGRVSGPSESFEQLGHTKWISMDSVIHVEVAEPIGHYVK